MKRRHFFLTGTAAAAAAALAPPAMAQLPIASVRAPRKALVMSGGGTRGAYQAGVVQAMVEKAGLRDGQPLDYDLICGTSIGAMNAYLVATAQYSNLQHAWQVIPSLDVTALKSPYYKIKDSSSGVLSRLFAAISLGVGLTNNRTGVINPNGVNEMLDLIIHPTDQVHLPLYVATTNLTRMRGEIFFRKATTPAGVQKQAVNDELLINYQLSVLRPASDDELRKMLFASAAIPVAFEPIFLPSVVKPGTEDAFVDGGVTENVPVEVARRCAHTLDVVLVDPPDPEPELPLNNATEIAMAVFAAMQRRILDYQIKLAFAESYAIANAGSNSTTNEIALDLAYIRPASELPGTFTDFSDAKAIQVMYERGYEDARSKGWTEFHLPDPREPRASG